MSQTGSSTPRRFGILGFFGVAVGVGCLLVSALGALNTAFDLNWQLTFYGSGFDLPGSWEECIGLGAVGLLLVGLSYFGRLVMQRFRAAKGRPLTRAGIVLGALALLFGAGRGLQLVALKSTYGCMLAYYATDGDLDDVRDALSDGPTRACLDAAVRRAAQYDNAPALAILLEGGADFLDEGTPAEQRLRCALAGTGPAFIEVALAHGVTPQTCPASDDLVWWLVNEDRDDAETAKVVNLLVKAGWSASRKPEHSDAPPAALAREKGKMATLAALEGGGR